MKSTFEKMGGDVYKRQVRMRSCWKPAPYTGICGRRTSARKTRCKGVLDVYKRQQYKKYKLASGDICSK